SELVHVFGFEVSQEDFFDGFPPDLLPRVTFHDGFSDPLHWRGSNSLSLQDFTVNGIRERLGTSSQNVTVVLDSLSWLLTRCPLPYVCHTIRDLARGQKGAGPRVTQVITLVHEDLHGVAVLDAVSLLADSVIHLWWFGDHFTVTHRKRTGRIVLTEGKIRVLKDFSLEISEEKETEPFNEKE
ncbi:elongator complex protein 5, partial [Rhinophrynus dorsalis]